MIFPWFFSFAAVIFLMILSFFFDLHENSYFYLTTFGIFSAFPLLLPVVDIIKKDANNSEKILSSSGIIGLIAIILAIILFIFFHFQLATIIFLVTMMVGAYFNIDSRWYFFVSLFGLMITIVSLICSQKLLAENFSILVYLSLVAGVIVEICAPFFNCFHKKSKPLVEFQENFIRDYKKEVKIYLFIIAAFLGISEIFLLFSQGKYLQFPMNSYVYIAIASIIFYIFGVILSESGDSFLNFFRHNVFLKKNEDLSNTKRNKNLSHFLIGVIAFVTSFLVIFLLNGVFSPISAIVCAVICGILSLSLYYLAPILYKYAQK